MGSEMARVWDGRRVKWFFIDNEIIDKFKLSPEADSLYIKLCRHANNQNGESRPSLRKWATEKHIGWEKMKAAANELIDKKLIKVIKEEHGKPKIYVILDVKGDSTSETPPQSGDSALETPQRHRDATSETPPPQGDSTSEHELNSLQNVKKTTNAPEGDSRKSPPAQEERDSLTPQSVYQDTYRGPEPKEWNANKDEDAFKKKPNPEAAAAMKAIANSITVPGILDDDNEGKTVALNCKDCGILTEFPSEEEAADGDCRKCGKPIFQTQEEK